MLETAPPPQAWVPPAPALRARPGTGPASPSPWLWGLPYLGSQSLLPGPERKDSGVHVWGQVALPLCPGARPGDPLPSILPAPVPASGVPEAPRLCSLLLLRAPLVRSAQGGVGGAQPGSGLGLGRVSAPLWPLASWKWGQWCRPSGVAGADCPRSSPTTRDAPACPLSGQWCSGAEVSAAVPAPTPLRVPWPRA